MPNRKRVVRRQERISSNGLRVKRSFNSRFAAWWLHNRQLLRDVSLDLIRRPFTSALTWLVMALAISLPVMVYVLNDNLVGLAGEWQAEGQVTLFLQTGVAKQDAESLAAELELRPDIRQVELVLPEQALKQFEAWSGLSQIISSLGGNPLPTTLIISPQWSSPVDLEVLEYTLQDLSLVEDMSVDLEWVVRLQQVIDLLWSMMFALGCVVLLAVFLVIGNTIRLAVVAKRQEIHVMRLIGATRRFMRRSFLYLACANALVAGVLGYLIAQLILVKLSDLLTNVAQIYVPGYLWHYGGLSLPLMVVALTVVVSWLAAFLTFSQQLRQITRQTVTL